MITINRVHKQKYINMHSSGHLCSRKVCSQHLQHHFSDKLEENLSASKFLHCKQYILPLTSPRKVVPYLTLLNFQLQLKKSILLAWAILGVITYNTLKYADSI